MSEGKELIKFDDVKSIAEFLQQPAVKMAEFITGILVSDTKDCEGGRSSDLSVEIGILV